MHAKTTLPRVCRACQGIIAPRLMTLPRPGVPTSRLQNEQSIGGSVRQRHYYSSQSEPRRSRALPRALAATAALAGAAFYYSTSSTPADTLNETTFAPYQVISRDAISPTSFVITLKPNSQTPSLPYLQPESSKWLHPLWSVEFKQPEVQIARHYTPLPVSEGEDARDGTLRFYIRTIGDGEMSNYLGRLRPGQAAWLRGPHWGFDIVKRLGGKRDVVVLAGGTGLVPGLQAAAAVLEGRDDTTIRILWAVRKREEAQNAPAPDRSWWQSPVPTELEAGLVSPSPVGKLVGQMKAKYGDRLQVKVAVDEEGSAFSAKDVAAALAGDGTKPTALLAGNSANCRLHSQVLHRAVAEFETETPGCSCEGPADIIGKNVLIVSGPDGFVSHFAGPKVWLGGIHTQGAVGGIVGQVQTQQPQRKDEWLVLKL